MAYGGVIFPLYKLVMPEKPLENMNLKLYFRYLVSKGGGVSGHAEMVSARVAGRHRS